MKTRVAVGLVSSLLALTTAAAPSSGAPATAAPELLTYLSTSDLHPPRGGASRALHGYIPLHARVLAQA